jgi:cytochrome P450
MPSLARSWEEVQQTFAWFEQMREHAPVSYDEHTQIWHVFRYEDVNQVITDHQRFSSRIMGSIAPLMEDTLIAQDPPDHRKLRNLVNQAFTPRAVAHRTELIRRITQEQLDAVKPHGRMDLVSGLAFPLPAKVIADLLGVPHADWDIFRRWASADLSSAEPRNEQTIRGELSAYLARLLKERRLDPRDDLVSALSEAEVDGERLSEQELINFCFLLLAAGHLSANARVMAWLASANHDAAQFPDPECFDIRREPNRHIAFGHGIHFCIGAPLGKRQN